VTVASAGPLCKQFVPRSREITTPTPHQSMFTGWMLFLTPNQQCQSTDGNSTEGNKEQNKISLKYTKNELPVFKFVNLLMP